MPIVAASSATSGRGLACGFVASLLCAGIALWPVLSAAQTAASTGVDRPDFAPTSKTGWLSSGTEFIALPSGPHPVAFDKAHPYVPNNRGQQPTLRVADVNNPILQPWVVEELKKVNERVLSGRAAFPPQVRCWPLGVPGFLLYPAQPVFFVQSPSEVSMIWQADSSSPDGASRRSTARSCSARPTSRLRSRPSLRPGTTPSFGGGSRPRSCAILCSPQAVIWRQLPARRIRSRPKPPGTSRSMIHSLPNMNPGSGVFT